MGFVVASPEIRNSWHAPGYFRLGGNGVTNDSRSFEEMQMTLVGLSLDLLGD